MHSLATLKTFYSYTIPDTVTNTRNEQFTERAVNELQPTQDVRLGNYQDSAPVSSTFTNPSTYQDLYKDFNMEVYTLNKAIDREYPMPKITWNTSTGVNGLLATYDFPSVLFSQPFIEEKINDFRLFRAGIRMSVRITASKFLYGKLMLVYIPYAHMDRDLSRYTNVNVLSGNPHVIISATASEAAVLDVPFISPFRALDLRTFNAKEMGEFRLYVLNPLIDITGVANSAQILVTAQFLDAQLMLPHHEFTPTSGEGALKSVKGLETGSLEVSDVVDATIGSLPGGKKYTGLFKKIETPLAIGAMMGLSKPAYVGTQCKAIMSCAEDLPHGKGMFYGVRNAMDPECQISTLPVTGGVDIDEMDLKYIVGTPMLRQQDVIGPTTAKALIFDPIFTTTPKTFVEFVANNFEYASGSFKIKIYVTSSLMHAVRGVFYLSDVATDDWQNCYHQVVDFQGDSEVTFVLPWTDQKVTRRATAPDTLAFKLYYTTLAWSQPDPVANTPIYFNVYVAGDTDWIFSGMKEVGFAVTSNPRADFAQPFQPFHESIVNYKHDKVVTGETYTTLREMVHRAHAYSQLTTVQYLDSYSTVGYNHGAYKGIELFGLLYRFWRGSIRFRFFQQSLTAKLTPVLMFPPNDLEPYLGVVTGNRFKQEFSIEVPYYEDTIWCGTKNPTNESTQLRVRAGTVGASMFFFKSAGDDFSYHFLSAFPPGVFYPLSAFSSPAQGLIAFQEFTA
jgi:hypothetical protein